MPDWLREIDHTADVGIRVVAATLPRLFERAAEGTFRVLADLAAVDGEEAEPITVTGRDRETLMVRWLSELNFRHTVDRQLFAEFAVESIEKEADEYTLTATVRGEAIDPNRHTVYTEIKAVTFHGLDVQATDDGWVVQIIFDM